MVKAEISFHPDSHPGPGSPDTLVFVLFDDKTLAPVVMDRGHGVLPFRANSAASSTDSVSIRIPSNMVRKEDEIGKPGIDIRELARVGTVFVEPPRPLYERLPMVKQLAERRRLKGLSEKEQKEETIIGFTKNCIAYGMLKGQEKINAFMKEMEESDVGLIVKDTLAALGTEIAIWAVNVPLGSAVFAITGGDLGAVFWSGVAVQGIIRGYYVIPRVKEEMTKIWHKKEETWKHIAKVGGFGAIYGLIIFPLDFTPIFGSIPLPFLSAPRNTKYVLKNLELGARKTYTKGKSLIGAVSRKINQIFHTGHESAVV